MLRVRYSVNATGQKETAPGGRPEAAVFRGLVALRGKPGINLLANLILL